MVAVSHRICRAVAALVLTASLLVVPNALARGKPGSGTNINPNTNCSEWPTSKTVIVLDPGHGGSDPGTGYDLTGDGLRTGEGDLLEKTVVLDIAKKVRTSLEAAGYAVCLTRLDDDTTLGNSERGDFANAVGARLFVMVHLNGSSDPNVNYTSTFWGKRRKDEAFSQHMLNALQGLTPGGGDFVGQFANGALLAASMESTLTESAFLTNSDEATAMQAANSPRRQEIANALAGGIVSYLP